MNQIVVNSNDIHNIKLLKSCSRNIESFVWPFCDVPQPTVV